MSTGVVHSNEMKDIILKLQAKTATENGTYTPDSDYDGFSKVTVNVAGSGGGIAGGVNVTFKSDSTDYMLMSVLSGNSVPEPVTPKKQGNFLSGWSETESDGELIKFPFAPQQDTTLYAQWTNRIVIGFTGLTNESGELTWTDDIANLEKWSTNPQGSYVEVTSPLDNVFPFSEIHEVTDNEDNVFVSFPKMYMKWITDSSGNIDGVKFSNIPVDDEYFISDAFLDPRNNGEYLDEVLIGKYEASGSSSKIFSKSKATCLVSVTRDGFRKAARAYGDSSNAYNGYQQYDIAMLTLYNFLCMLYYKTANIQTVFAGRTSESSKSDTGTCDTISGLNGWNTATNCVKMLGVENPYGNIYKWVDGIVFSDSTIYAQKLPTGYTDSTGGNTFGFSRPISNGNIKYLKAGSNATKSLVYCSSTGGSSTTYVGDYYYYASGGTVLYSGGYWGSGAGAGLWYLSGDYEASRSDSYRGGRLCRRPLN